MTVATSTASANSTVSENSEDSGMKIEILSLVEKQTSLLVDAVRILAWEQFKVTYKQELRDSRLEYGGYALFDQEWKKQPYISMNLEEITAFILSLGYSVNGLLNYRIQYYAKKAAYAQKNQPQNQGSLRSAETEQAALPAGTPADYANEEF